MDTEQPWAIVEDQRLRVAAFLEPLTEHEWATRPCATGGR